MKYHHRIPADRLDAEHGFKSRDSSGRYARRERDRLIAIMGLPVGTEEDRERSIAIVENSHKNLAMCPSDDELIAYLRDPYHGKDAEAIADHLDRCADCDERAESAEVRPGSGRRLIHPASTGRAS